MEGRIPFGLDPVFLAIHQIPLATERPCFSNLLYTSADRGWDALNFPMVFSPYFFMRSSRGFMVVSKLSTPVLKRVYLVSLVESLCVDVQRRE